MTIGDVFDVVRGGSPRPINDFITNDLDGVNWIMIGDVAEGSKYITKTKKRIIPAGVKKSRMVYPGDFLLTNSMSFGRPYILQTTGCIHDGWLVLRSKGDNVNHDYVYYLLGSKEIYSELKRQAAGAVVKNLNIGIVKNIKISLPPLPVQQKIATILDTADALKQKDKALIAKYDELSQSLFLDMFGDPVINPNKWPSKKLNALASIASGVTKGRKIKADKFIELPYMRVANVQDGYLDLSEIKTIPGIEKDLSRYGLKMNDILLTEGGDPDKLGRGAIWHDEIKNCIHQNHIFRVRLTDTKITPMFFSKLCGSAYGKRYFLRSGKQTTGIASINKTQLSNFPALLPPIALQNQFAKQIQAIEQQKQHAQASLQKSEELFNCLLQKAFTGELV